MKLSLESSLRGDDWDQAIRCKRISNTLQSVFVQSTVKRSNFMNHILKKQIDNNVNIYLLTCRAVSPRNPAVPEIMLLSIGFSTRKFLSSRTHIPYQ